MAFQFLVNNDDPTNFYVGPGTTYVFHFPDQDLFNDFNFVGYGNHEVTRSFPSITLNVRADGPTTFQFFSSFIRGEVIVSDTCGTCTAYSGYDSDDPAAPLIQSTYIQQFFYTADEVLSNNIYEYLTSCEYHLNDSAINEPKIDVLGQITGPPPTPTPGGEQIPGTVYNLYSVGFCCTPVKPSNIPTPTRTTWPNITFCALQWYADINCVGGKEVYSNLDGPYYFEDPDDPFASPCKSSSQLPDIRDKWSLALTEDHSGDCEGRICYVRASETCGGDCTESSMPSGYFDDPALPESDQGFFRTGCSPVATPTPEVKLAELTEVDIDPNNSRYVAFVGCTTTLDSPNLTDKQDTCYYKETLDKYYSQRSITVLCEPIAGEQYNISGKYVNYVPYNQGDEKKFASYAAVIDYSSSAPPPPPPVADNSLIQDKPLVAKIYDVTNIYSSPNPGQTAAELNWGYWFNDLPKAVYGGSSNWWNGIPDANLPKFEIIDFNADTTVRFPSGANSVIFSQSSNEYDTLKITDYGTPDFHEEYYDPVFGAQFNSGLFYVFELEYTFNPLSSAIDSAYSGVTVPIIRKERVSMIEPYPYNESWGSFPYNYGVDKTAGLSHYPHAIIEGHFIKV